MKLIPLSKPVDIQDITVHYKVFQGKKYKFIHNYWRNNNKLLHIEIYKAYYGPPPCNVKFIDNNHHNLSIKNLTASKIKRSCMSWKNTRHKHKL